MKLFALGRTDLANSCKLCFAGKAEKFTEMVVIPLRILSSVGDAWRPPGHPWRLRPIQVVSLLDTVVHTLSRAVLVAVVCVMCGVHNITEILNILSSIDSNYLLKFHLACFSCFRTAQTTANNRHVFRVDKLPDRPPRFHIPRHFPPKVQSISPENFISVFFGWNSKSRDQTVLKGGSTSNNMPSGRTGKALFYWKVEGPRSSNVQVMSKAKKSAKKR